MVPFKPEGFVCGEPGVPFVEQYIFIACDRHHQSLCWQSLLLLPLIIRQGRSLAALPTVSALGQIAFILVMPSGARRFVRSRRADLPGVHSYKSVCAERMILSCSSARVFSQQTPIAHLNLPKTCLSTSQPFQTELRRVQFPSTTNLRSHACHPRNRDFHHLASGH